jgi:hypothetical protein
LTKIKNESTAKGVSYRSDAAFAAAASVSRHAHVCFVVHPSWFVFVTLCALGVSAVRFCSEVKNINWHAPGSPAAHENNVLFVGLMKIEDHSISQIR